MNHFSVVHSTALDLRLTGSDLQRLWRSVVFAWSMLPVSSACLDTKHKAVKEQFGKIKFCYILTLKCTFADSAPTA